MLASCLGLRLTCFLPPDACLLDLLTFLLPLVYPESYWIIWKNPLVTGIPVKDRSGPATVTVTKPRASHWHMPGRCGSRKNGSQETEPGGKVHVSCAGVTRQKNRLS